jgi:hypothetical protein
MSGSGHYPLPVPTGSQPGVPSVPSVHGHGGAGSYPGDGHQSNPSVSTGSIAHASVSRSGPQSALPYPRGESSNKRLTLVALAVAAAAGGLAALLYLSVGRRDDVAAAAPTTAVVTGAPQATQTTAPPAPTASASAAELAKVAIEVKAKPDSAEVYLDGEKVGEPGKASLSIPQDGKPHELRVSATGYASKTYKIEPDQTKVEWSPELVRERAATGGGQVVTPPSAKTAEGDKKCSKKGKSGRCIDAQYDP